MKNINDLLKQAYKYADNTAVKLNLHVPLKKLRDNAKLLSSLGVSQVTVLGAAKKVKPAAKKAKAKPKAKKKAVAKKGPVAKAKPKAAAKKKPAKAKEKAKKAPAKRGSATTTMVTQEGVLKAIRAKNHTPQDIANAMNANPVQVGKALSRYTQKKIIRRIKPGHYALK